MKRLRSGSNQMDVPVKPVWPNAFGPIFVPALEFSDGVSQPRAREEPGGMFWRWVNNRTVSLLMHGAGGPQYRTWLGSSILKQSNHVANFAKSDALLNSPACPETPPNRPAFSSCTSPRSSRWRKTVSFSVGAMRSRQLSGGR